MDRDPYQLCPCGSGNKLKFCCADVAAEMEKLERLLANNQPRMALQGLEKLYETHSESQWVRTVLASTLINEGRADEAKKVLAGLLKQHPQQPFANVLYALAAFNADGYPDCKRAVHRAFKHSTSAFPELVGTLTSALADHFESVEAVMAARQYRVLSLRLAHEDARRELFEDLVELDSNTAVPYPLRSVRHPEDLNDLGGDQPSLRMASRYSAVGCWEEAADVLEKLTDAQPSNTALWYNIGLYRAWDADHPRAAAAFRRASQASDDFDRAVECEVLAQLLERSDPERGRRMQLRRFDLSSVSQILTRLDEAERVARLDDRFGSDPDRQAGGPVGRFVILSRAIGRDEDYSDWTWESVPLIEGRLTVFDRDEQSDQPAQAFLVGLEGDELERAADVLVSITNGLAEPVRSEDEARSDTHFTGQIPSEELPLRWAGFVPPTAPAAIGRRTAEQHWRQVLNEVWPNTPCAALAGKTPLECAGDEAHRVPLAAALVVLDTYADSRSYLLPLEDLRERFQITPPSPITPDERTNINLLTLLQIERLRRDQLSPEQFDQVLKRASLVRHNRLLYAILQEALLRPETSDSWEKEDRILAALTGICGAALRRDEMLEWVRRGRQLAESQRHSFEPVLQWKMKDLAIRIEDPDDGQLRELLDDLWQNYGAKLPQLREYLVTLVDVARVTPPWESVIVTPAAVGGIGGGDSWRGESENPAAAGKKLWLPGDSD
ncbi:MAG: tetratricopeptide repeat protein [Planctomycetaceae bacterium]